MRKPIIAGNWKCYQTLRETDALVRAVRAGCETDAVALDVVICPPFTSLSRAAELLADGSSPIALGAQDLHWEPQGAFTGEVSGPMLRDAGCRYVIVGHSERRTLFGETDQIVARKLVAAKRCDLIPMLCIGETLSDRESGRTFEVLQRQLQAALAEPAVWSDRRLVLAYEPVWAIGTGKNATPDQAQEAHAFIRRWVAERCAPEAAEMLRIQYGGSVNAANAAALLEQPDVDGALVGGASLKADVFSSIVKSAVNRKPARAQR